MNENTIVYIFATNGNPAILNIIVYQNSQQLHNFTDNLTGIVCSYSPFQGVQVVSCKLNLNEIVVAFKQGGVNKHVYAQVYNINTGAKRKGLKTITSTPNSNSLTTIANISDNEVIIGHTSEPTPSNYICKYRIYNIDAETVITSTNQPTTISYCYLTKLQNNSSVTLRNGFYNFNRINIDFVDNTTANTVSGSQLNGSDAVTSYANILPLSNGGFLQVTATNVNLPTQDTVYVRKYSGASPPVLDSSCDKTVNIDLQNQYWEVNLHESIGKITITYVPSVAINSIRYFDLDFLTCEIVNNDIEVYNNSDERIDQPSAFLIKNNNTNLLYLSFIRKVSGIQEYVLGIYYIGDTENSSCTDNTKHLICYLNANQVCVGLTDIGPCQICKGSDSTQMDIRRHDIDNTCTCDDRKYDDPDLIDCQDCELVCATCEKPNPNTNCLTCITPQLRLNPPLCECSFGRDHVDNGGSDPTCECLGSKRDISGTYPNIYYCESCEQIIAIQSFFNQEITLYTIEFTQPIQILSLALDIQQNYSGQNCKDIFDQNSLDKLGIGYQCKFSNNQKFLYVEIGFQATITTDDILSINPGKLVNKDPLNPCALGNEVNSIVNNSIEYNFVSYPQPNISVILPQSQQTICNSIQIFITSVTGDAKRGLKQIDWQFTNVSTNDNQHLLDLNQNYVQQAQNQYQLNIPSLILQSQATYTVQIDFINQFDNTNSEIQQFSTGGDIGFVTKNNFEIQEYFVWDIVPLSVQFQKLICSGQIELQLDKKIVVNWTSNALPNINQQQILDIGVAWSRINIDQYTAIPNTNYDINVSLQEEGSTEIQNFSYQLKYKQSDLRVYIKGGNRIHFYTKILSLEADVNDPDNQNSQISDFNISWSCIQLDTNGDCYNGLNELIKDFSILNGQNQFQIEEYFLVPYKVYQFNIDVDISGLRAKRDTAIILSQELDLPYLEVVLPLGILEKSININDEIFTTLNYDLPVDNQNQLSYAATVLYNLRPIGVKTFKFNKGRIRIWDFIDTFTQDNNKVQVRYNVYNPMYMMPSSTQITYKINLPPINCQLNIQNTDNISLSSIYTIKISGCQDEQLPIQYSYGIYDNQQELNEEILNPLNQKRLIFSDKQPINQIQTVLPMQNDQDLQNQIILVQAIDNLGGIFNITQEIRVESNQSISEEQYLNNANNLIQQESGKSFQDKIRILSIIAYDIIRNQVIDQDSENILIFKQEIIDNLSQLQDSLSPESQLESQITKTIDLLYKKSGKSLLNMKDQDQINEQFQNIQNVIDTKEQLAQQIPLDKRQTEQTIEADKIDRIAQNQFSVLNSMISGISDKSQNQKAGFNENIFKISNKVGKLINNNFLPNEDIKSYVGEKLKVRNQVITQREMGFYISQGSQWQNFQNLNDNQVVNNEEFSVSFKQFEENPFQNSNKFYYKLQKQRAIDPLIQQNGLNTLRQLQNNLNDFNPNTGKLDIGNQEIIHEFGIQEEQNSKNVCIQANDNIEWDNANCQTLENDDGSLKCVCKDLSVTTIVNDIENIFLDSKADEIFGSEGIQALQNFQFWKSAIFYLFIGSSVFILFGILRGYQLDKQEQQQNTKIQPIDNNTDNLDQESQNNQNLFIKKITLPISSDYQQDIKQNDFNDNKSQISNQVTEQKSRDGNNKNLQEQNENNENNENQDDKQEIEEKQNIQKGNTNKKRKRNKKKAQKSLNDKISSNLQIEQVLQDKESQQEQSDNQNLKLQIDNQQNSNVESEIQLQQDKISTDRNLVQEQNIDDSEEKKEEIYEFKKKKSIVQGIFIYHELFSCFYLFQENISRPSRFIIYYCKILSVMAVSAILVQNIENRYYSIVMLSVCSILTGIPIAILTILLSSKNKIVNSIGLIFSFGIYGVSFWIILINAALIGIDESNDWAVEYGTTILIDVFITQMLITGLKLRIFNMEIKSNKQKLTPLQKAFKDVKDFFNE